MSDGIYENVSGPVQNIHPRELPSGFDVNFIIGRREKDQYTESELARHIACQFLSLEEEVGRIFVKELAGKKHTVVQMIYYRYGELISGEEIYGIRVTLAPVQYRDIEMLRYVAKPIQPEPRPVSPLTLHDHVIDLIGRDKNGRRKSFSGRRTSRRR